MSAKSIVLAAAVLLFAPRAHATIVEIPLPQLYGYYQNTSHIVTVVLPAPPAVIHGVSFRLSGTRTNGQIYCDDQIPPIQGPLPIALYAELASDDYASVWFAEEHSASTSEGAFSWTESFHPASNATWSFLMDGTAHLTFYGIDPGTWCQIPLSPSAVITEAVVIIDADFPIAVEATTWGKVKALYR